MQTQQKDLLDRFYTKPEVVDLCLKGLTHKLSDFDTLVEPSAGDGSFIDRLDHFNIYAYDIAPGRDDIQQADWFDVDISSFGNTCVIGNPPFGVRNKITIKFVEHSISFKNVTMVAMILPDSWNKPSLQKTFPRNWKLTSVTRLERNSFTLFGEPFKIPCTFQVWEKDSEEEDLRWDENPAVTHPDFDILLTGEDADFYMMGAAPKNLKNIKDVSLNNRGYYIKSNIGIEKLKDAFNRIPWDDIGNATAGGGVYWISKPELIKAYTEGYE